MVLRIDKKFALVFLGAVFSFFTTSNALRADTVYYSVYTSVPPTIDGTISVGEWTNDTAITLNGFNNPANTKSGTFYVMHDFTYIYLCVVIPDTQSDPGDYLMHDFDVGNDSFPTIGGEDGINMALTGYPAGNPTEFDIYWDGTWWGGDTVQNGDSGITYGANQYIYECRKPLNSGDAADMAIGPGDTLGYRIETWDSAYASAGEWFRFPLNTADFDTTAWVDTPWVDLVIQPKDTSVANVWYVDDMSNAGDSWTGTADGYDTNDGMSIISPFRTISRALQFATQGDTIYIDAGTFSETVSIDTDNLYLIGAGGDSTIIDYGDSSQVTNARGIYSNGHTGLLIRNVGVRNTYDGIYLVSVTNSVIENVYANYNGFGGINLASGNSNNILISNVCTNNDYGIVVQNSSNNNSVTNNSGSSNDTFGIIIASTSNDNIVSQNTFSSNLEDQVDYAWNNTIDTFVKNNVITSTGNPDSGVWSNITSSVDFTRNWWGTTDSEAIDTMIWGPADSYVIYMPYRLGVVDTAAGADSIAPAAPDTVAVDTSTGGQITVSWAAVSTNEEGVAWTNDLGGYRVYRSTNLSTSDWFDSGNVVGNGLLGSVASGITSLLDDTNLVVGETYYYRVTSLDTNATYENESWFSDSIISGVAQAVAASISTLAISSVNISPPVVSRGQGNPDSMAILVNVYNGSSSETTTVYAGYGTGFETFTFTNGSTVETAYTIIFDSAVQGDTILSPNNDSTVLLYYVTLVGDTANTGTVSFNIQIAGTSAISGTVSATDTSTFTVQSSATVAIQSVVITNITVDTGQSGLDSIPVNVVLTNSGEATARVDTLYLTFYRLGSIINDSFTVSSDSTLPLTLSGGQTDTFLLHVSINVLATTGPVMVNATCTAIDVNGTTSLGNVGDDTAGIMDTFTIQSPANIVLDNIMVTGTDTTFSAGVQSNSIAMVVSNTGEATATIIPGLTFLVFDTGSLGGGIDAYFPEAVVSGNPSVIYGNSTDTLYFQVIVDPLTPAPDSILISGTITIQDSNAPNTIIDTGTYRDPNDSYDLISGGALSAETVMVSSPDTLTQGGGDSLYVTAQFRNPGSGVAYVTDTPGLAVRRLSDSTVFTSNFTVTFVSSDTAFPTSLPSGDSFTCTYTISALSSAPLDVMAVDGYIQGTIPVGGGKNVVDSTSTSYDTLLVDTTAGASTVVITASAPAFDRTIVDINGTDTFSVTITLTNSGSIGGTVTLANTDLVMTNTNNGFDVSGTFTVAAQAPLTFLLNGGANTTTIVYIVTVPGTGTANVEGAILVNLVSGQPQILHSYTSAVETATLGSSVAILAASVVPDTSTGDTIYYAPFTLNGDTPSVTEKSGTPTFAFEQDPGADSTAQQSSINAANSSLTSDQTTYSADYESYLGTSVSSGGSIIEITTNPTNATGTFIVSIPIPAGVPSSAYPYLRIAKLDEVNNVWGVLSDGSTTPNGVQGSNVVAEVSRFSIFRVVTIAAGGAQVEPNLDNARVYPNPFVPNDGDEQTGRDYIAGDDQTGLIIAGLTSSVTITIYNQRGKEIAKTNTTDAPSVRWDVKTRAGHKVASGTYFFVLKDNNSGKIKVLKAAIIR